MPAPSPTIDVSITTGSITLDNLQYRFSTVIEPSYGARLVDLHSYGGRIRLRVRWQGVPPTVEQVDFVRRDVQHMLPAHILVDFDHEVELYEQIPVHGIEGYVGTTRDRVPWIRPGDLVGLNAAGELIPASPTAPVLGIFAWDGFNELVAHSVRDDQLSYGSPVLPLRPHVNSKLAPLLEQQIVNEGSVRLQSWSRLGLGDPRDPTVETTTLELVRYGNAHELDAAIINACVHKEVTRNVPEENAFEIVASLHARDSIVIVHPETYWLILQKSPQCRGIYNFEARSFLQCDACPQGILVVVPNQRCQFGVLYSRQDGRYAVSIHTNQVKIMELAKPPVLTAWQRVMMEDILEKPCPPPRTASTGQTWCTRLMEEVS